MAWVEVATKGNHLFIRLRFGSDAQTHTTMNVPTFASSLLGAVFVQMVQLV